jgi:hypothetical protein
MKGVHVKNVMRFVSLGTAAVLAACGGSSSGGGSSGPPPIQIAYTGPTSSVSLDSTAAAGALVTGARTGLADFSSAGSAATVIGAAGAGRRSSVQLALSAVEKFRTGGAASVKGVTQPDTQPCAVSGSSTSTVSFADPTLATLAVGDSFSVTYNACDDGLGEVSAGTVTVTITACPDGKMFLDPTSMTPGVLYEMTEVATDLVVVDSLGYYSGTDGDMAVGMVFETDLDGTGGWLTMTVSGNSLAFAEGANGVALASAKLTGLAGGRYALESGMHFPVDLYSSPDASSSAFTARICTSDLGGCLDVLTNPAFVVNGYDYYPSSGTMRTTDDAGHFVEVTATNGTTGAVTVTYDIGAGVVGPKATTWSCLDQADSSACF